MPTELAVLRIAAFVLGVLLLLLWRRERTIRRDAVGRSRAVIAGKVAEHVTPYLPDFVWNPKDARFIGSPIDFVIFDGLDDGDDVHVVFVEIKTGVAQLSARERRVRDAVRAGRVEWQEIRIEPDEAPGRQRLSRLE